MFFFTIAGMLLSKYGLFQNDYSSIIVHAEQQLHAKEKILSQIVHQEASLTDTAVFGKKERNKVLSSDGFYFLIFRNNDLIYWSDNRVAFDKAWEKIPENHSLIKLKNGWFEVISEKKAEKTVIGLLLIKNEYSYQNRYLVNEFNLVFDFPEGTVLQTDSASGAYGIKTENKHPLFFAGFNKISEQNKNYGTWANILFLFSLFIFCYLIHYTGKHLFRKTEAPHRFFIFKVTAFFILIIGIRFLSFYFRVPDFLYNLPVFGPSHYAGASILSSLGDLLINTIICFYITAFFYRRIACLKCSGFFLHKKYLTFVAAIATVTTVFILAFGTDRLLYGLIFHSSISFNVNNIFSLNGYSLCAFIITGLLFFSFFLIADMLVQFVQKTFASFSQVLFVFLSGGSIFVLFTILANVFTLPDFHNLTVFLFCIFILSVLFYFRIRSYEQLSYTPTLSVVFLITVIVSMKTAFYSSEKEKENRKILAEKLSHERDPVAEHLFESMEQKISSDSILLASLSDEKKLTETGVKRIHQLYFNEYWSKYDSKLHIYDASGKGLFNSNNENVGQDYFLKVISEQGKPTGSRNLFFLPQPTGETGYLARIPLLSFSSTKDTTGMLIVELGTKHIQEESGFPDLLLSNKVSVSKEFSNYSYAKYRNGTLITRQGNYSYYSSSQSFTVIHTRKQFVGMDSEGYNHLLFKPENNTLIVVSKKNSGWLDYITLFSYLFAFFMLFSFVLSALKLLPVKLPDMEWNLKGRIRFSMVFLVAISLVLIGTSTVYYLINSYNSKQYEQIRQKVNTLRIAIENQLGSQRILSVDVLKNFTYNLMMLSENLSVDFSIYNLKGELLFSSQPKIFEQEIIANKINASAFEQLTSQQKQQLIHNESIGKLNYISAYETLRNPGNKRLGYLELPYFSKQSELKKEISSFLVALINIYILLFALALMLALLIANRITQPLKLISSKLEETGKIKLGKRNEHIIWTKNDEIGELVKEYNRMADELAVSAEMLAKSERESAWREMAKQIAHEIKNPLTPMKLSVQHLQKVWNENSTSAKPEFFAAMDKIISRITQTLIQQIDTLSAIAGEFSNFAQLPRPNNEIVDLKEIAEHCINLFKETADIHFVFSYPDENKQKNGSGRKYTGFFVFADKAHLYRVLTNLIQNAVQAIPEGKEGKITVSIEKSAPSGFPDNHYIVSVKDNGTGIDEGLQKKIFTPNFTTKTGGMGLGLAMVKNIIENMGGTAGFETQKNYGTTFFFKLPAAR